MPSTTRDVKNYLFYWRRRNADSRLATQFLLDHAGSSQFRYLQPNDVIWIVTVRNGGLVLIGRLIVGEVTDRTSAMRILGRTNIEKGSFIALAKHGTEERLRA